MISGHVPRRRRPSDLRGVRRGSSAGSERVVPGAGGRSSRIDDLEGKCDGVIKRQRTARCIGRIESLFAKRVDRSGGGLLVETLDWRGWFAHLLPQLVGFPEQPGRRPGIRGGDRRDFEDQADPAPGIEVEPSAKALASVAHAPCRSVLDRRARPRARGRRLRPHASSPTDSKDASASSYKASASENLPCFRATSARLLRGTPTSIPSSRALASTSWYTAFARSRSPRSSATKPTLRRARFAPSSSPSSRYSRPRSSAYRSASSHSPSSAAIATMSRSASARSSGLGSRAISTREVVPRLRHIAADRPVPHERDSDAKADFRVGG